MDCLTHAMHVKTQQKARASTAAGPTMALVLSLVSDLPSSAVPPPLRPLSVQHPLCIVCVLQLPFPPSLCFRLPSSCTRGIQALFLCLVDPPHSGLPLGGMNKTTRLHLFFCTLDIRLDGKIDLGDVRCAQNLIWHRTRLVLFQPARKFVGNLPTKLD